MWLLRESGLWVERHSYSFRIMYGGRIVGSLHIYPGFREAILKVYNVNEGEASYVVSTVRRVFETLFPEYELSVKAII